MQIPGHIDPVPVPRAAVVRKDGKTDLIGLPKGEIRAALETAGMEPKQAKLRAKQLWHWIYNRGVTDFALMTDIAKKMHPWLTEHFVISRPEVVEAQVSSDGTRKCSQPRSTVWPADPAYDGASPAKRTAIFFERMVRERLLDAACVLMANRSTGAVGQVSTTLSFDSFAAAVFGRCLQFRATNSDLWRDC